LTIWPVSVASALDSDRIALALSATTPAICADSTS
jgi:hypothetical protein